MTSAADQLLAEAVRVLSGLSPTQQIYNEFKSGMKEAGYTLTKEDASRLYASAKEAVAKRAKESGEAPPQEESAIPSRAAAGSSIPSGSAPNNEEYNPEEEGEGEFDAQEAYTANGDETGLNSGGDPEREGESKDEGQFLSFEEARQGFLVP